MWATSCDLDGEQRRQNEKEGKWSPARLPELLSAVLSSNTTASSSSTALQTFLHYVTLTNEAVMSRRQAVVIQLSSVCVCVFSVAMSGRYTSIPELCLFVVGALSSAFGNTGKWWNAPLRRWRREKRVKGYQLVSSKAPLLLLLGHLRAAAHNKTAPGIRLDRRAAALSGPAASGSYLAHKLSPSLFNDMPPIDFSRKKVIFF